MAFKLKPYYCTDKLNTPIYKTEFEDGKTHGVTLKTGAIVLNKYLPLDEEEKTIAHEMVHSDQIKRGDLRFTDKEVYWKGKIYQRSKITDGDKNLPWEKEAYAKQEKI